MTSPEKASSKLQVLRCKDWLQEQNSLNTKRLSQQNKNDIQFIIQTNAARKKFLQSIPEDDATLPAGVGEPEEEPKTVPLHKLRVDWLKMDCQWGSCHWSYNNYEDFQRHVQKHISDLHVIDKEGYVEYVCLWDVCGHNSSDFKEMVRHVNYHAYHARLMAIGFNGRATLKLIATKSSTLFRYHYSLFLMKNAQKITLCLAPLMGSEHMKYLQLNKNSCEDLEFKKHPNNKSNGPVISQITIQITHCKTKRYSVLRSCKVAHKVYRCSAMLMGWMRNDVYPAYFTDDARTLTHGREAHSLLPLRTALCVQQETGRSRKETGLFPLSGITRPFVQRAEEAQPGAMNKCGLAAHLAHNDNYKRNRRCAAPEPQLQLHVQRVRRVRGHGVPAARAHAPARVHVRVRAVRHVRAHARRAGHARALPAPAARRPAPRLPALRLQRKNKVDMPQIPRLILKSRKKSRDFLNKIYLLLHNLNYCTHDVAKLTSMKERNKERRNKGIPGRAVCKSDLRKHLPIHTRKRKRSNTENSGLDISDEEHSDLESKQCKPVRKYACHMCPEKSMKVFHRGSRLTTHLVQVHGAQWPFGHSRFRYQISEDGMYRLTTTRYEILEVSKKIVDGYSDPKESLKTSFEFNIKQVAEATESTPKRFEITLKGDDENTLKNTPHADDNRVVITVCDVDELGNIINTKVVPNSDVVIYSSDDKKDIS
ncbi:unnamed protein product [Diatraea saccharalis]|uniref:C2H2-type domain-containing protein n=1 Tax=Diatraea saccharalis TaxID=40085 RepID=A0A9N9R7A7_9NEOP|nr:unnamed protein product [Diatraea saccharalis]